MEVVTGATGSVLTKVAVLLQEEYIRQKGVKKDVESLQKELFFMRAALCKVAEVPPEQLDEQVKAWASHVKELSYNMEDAVDTFNVRGRAIKEHSSLWTIDLDMFDRFWARHELADVIAEMKDLTMQVAELRDRYKLDDVNVTTSTIVQMQDMKPVVVPTEYSQLWAWWRRCISSQIQDMWTRCHVPHFIGITGLMSATDSHPGQILIPRLIVMKAPSGMRNEMKKLGAWLVKSTTADIIEGMKGDGGVGKMTAAKATTKKDNGTVLYMYGNGGLGKTTMAIALYRKFGHEFKRRASVTALSMGSDCTAILAKINEQFGPPNEAVDGDENQANDALRSKSLGDLVLIDAVESDETLRNVRAGLPHDCRIIVTTRHAMVASSYDEKNGDMRHDMVALGEKEAKDIFMEALSGSTEDGDDQEKELRYSGKHNIPPRVWKMCVEEPVALIAMAGYAACNQHMALDGWEQVCSKLLPDSVKTLTRAGIPRVLSHCYHDMPAQIKTCSLYLSMYPKGSIIRRKHLTRRWIAEGFVGERPGKSAEEVADEYFEQLIMRKIIQPMEESNNGKVKNCQVHELVHDFIVYKASEENLVTVVGSGYLLPPPSGKVRRLSYSVPESDDGVGDGTTVDREENIPWQKIMKIRNRDETLASVGNMSHVRSLAVFWGFNTKNKALPSGLLDSPIVQVLDLEGCNDPLLETRHMKVIYKMLLLKYLSLRGTCIKELKEDIGNLKNLETLDVRETDVQLLPDTIWNLQQLVSILGGNKKTRKALKLKIPAAAKNSKDVGDTDTAELHDTTWNLQQLVCILGRDKKRSKALKFRIMMKALRVLSGIEITKELAQHLENLPNLRKLAIYKVDTDTNSGKSMLEFLGHRCLRTLVIMADDDNLSGFFSNSPAPSLKLLAALELFGNLKKLPTWIKGLVDLTKLTLPITVFSSDPQLLAKLHKLENLFSLTFSGDELHLPRGKEIIVPTGGFTKLKLLHFCAPFLPPLSFLDDAMPSLERISLCFSKFEGIHGIHNLQMLQEVHLKVHARATPFTMSMVNNLADAMRKDAKGPRIICDRYVKSSEELS